MDQNVARELLTRERTRIEQAIAGLERDGSLESTDRREPGDAGTQDLYQDEFNQGRSQQLRKQLAALERAEARLAAGTYGLSIESGDPIPDQRLVAVPTAERTVEEDQRYQRG